MTETFVALLLGHLLADFVLQTNRMVAEKRRPLVLLGHAAVVGLASLATLGGAPGLILAVAVAHLVTDAVKTWAAPETLAVFLLDQAAHLATLAVAAWVMPGAFASGLWGGLPDTLLQAQVVLAGLIAATFAGGPAVGLLMRPYDSPELPAGLPNGGRMIGLLERLLIVLLVLVGEAAAIGFLIAAKSILRFDMASESRAAGEYVIIGTLASFAWALAAGFATEHALAFLAPV
ncbi:DUF3307 domain-containing protein [Pseudooceanicola sp.]|uniref:DUF3307 domain-containing protein n=1 Tax=Pseudooceanicola sp. TaxID=1914328 RepID=UPI004057DCCB